MVAIIAASVATSAAAPLLDTYPAMPHISGQHARAMLEPERQRDETVFVVAGAIARAASPDGESRTGGHDVADTSW
jgi:hypothetical protein